MVNSLSPIIQVADLMLCLAWGDDRGDQQKLFRAVRTFENRRL